jgi:hypothetical protein
MITRRLLFRQAAEQNSDAFSLTQEWYLFHVPLGPRAGPAPVPPLARSLLRLLRLRISYGSQTSPHLYARRRMRRKKMKIMVDDQKLFFGIFSNSGHGR